MLSHFITTRWRCAPYDWGPAHWKQFSYQSKYAEKPRKRACLVTINGKCRANSHACERKGALVDVWHTDECPLSAKQLPACLNVGKNIGVAVFFDSEHVMNSSVLRWLEWLARMHANGTKLQVMDRPPAFGPDTQGRVFYVLPGLVI